MRVLRWEIPVDDAEHPLALSGRIVHVAARRPDVVEIWSEENGAGRTEHIFRVFGTGHQVAGPWRHVGTAVAGFGDLVWHLYERWPR